MKVLARFLFRYGFYPFRVHGEPFVEHYESQVGDLLSVELAFVGVEVQSCFGQSFDYDSYVCLVFVQGGAVYQYVVEVRRTENV